MGSVRLVDATGSGPSDEAGQALITHAQTMGRVLLVGAGIGVAAGAVSGLFALGPLAMVVGAFVGGIVAVVPAFVGALAIANAIDDGPERFRRRVDATLATCAVVVAIVSALWLAQDALSGPATPISALITVLLGLAFARYWLRQLEVPPPPP